MDLQKFKEEIQKRLGTPTLEGSVTGLVVSLIITEEELVSGLDEGDVSDMVDVIEKAMKARNLKKAIIADIAITPEPKGMRRIVAWLHLGN